MTSADAVLAAAVRHVGTYFGAKSPFNAWYPMDGYWCAMFVSWCAHQAGALDTIIPKHSYTPTGAQWFKNRGAWTAGTRGIRRGDIVYFDFGVGRISHVGIVETSNPDGSFYSIEGNTSLSDRGNQRSSGAVARKHRKVGNVVGYGRPAYTGQSSGGGMSASDEDLVRLRLVRQKDSPRVYLADYMKRRWVTNETELRDLQWQMTHVLRVDPTVHVVDRIEAFGKEI